MAFSGVGFALPLGLNSVEGSEAALLVAGSASRGGWRKATVAALAALVTLVPVAVGLYFAFRYLPGEDIDYAIASLIFLLGVREAVEGLGERGEQAPRPHFAGLPGPLGIDPTDPASIEAFQRSHGLAVDGVIGPRTRGAIVAEVAARAEDPPESDRLRVDILDEESVRRFQRAHGLEGDGIVGPRTQGALAAEAAWLLLDPADPDSVGRFQMHYGLPATGQVDAATQAALRALRAEQGHGSGGPSSPDITDPDSIRRFQRARGLEATGVLDGRAQGALRSEHEHRRASLGVDPGDPESVRRFQRRHALEETGTIGADMQAAMARARSELAPSTQSEREVLGLDPTDPESVRRFQREHALEPSGEIDEKTQDALQRWQELTLGLDVTDPEAIARFQTEHGLASTGTVDAATQGSIRALRADLRRAREHEDGQDPEQRWLPLDPADPEQIARFQAEHGLPDDGVIGPRTQAALRAVLAEQRDRRVETESSGERPGGVAGRLGAYAPVWPAYVGGVLEGSEAVLYTFGVAHGSAGALAAAVGGGIGFSLPWVALRALRRLVDRLPEWKVELSVGLVLMAAAGTFGVLRATGVFGG